MKKKIIIGVIALIIIASGSFALYKVLSHKEEPVATDASKFKEEYESLNNQVNESNNKEYRTVTISDDNPFIYKSAEELAQMIEDGKTFVVYFGYNSCPWCRSIISTLDSVAKEENVGEIYYVDIHDIRDTLTLNSKGKAEITKEGSEGYNKLLDLLSDVLSDYTLTNDKGKTVKTGEKRIYAPNVVVVVDGQAKKLVEGNSPKQTDAYMELTEEMLNDTKEQFKEVLQIFKDNDCASQTVC